jgi:hypothetical protein
VAVEAVAVGGFNGALKGEYVGFHEASGPMKGKKGTKGFLARISRITRDFGFLLPLNPGIRIAKAQHGTVLWEDNFK